ncbi:hypothetical protein JKP88DRAFT_311493 [Tribonema minus]|uniref:SET domain-containing protein n=1 Tax=Tribonema minus TaxID=303371 RepID=A0A835Z1T0_9STRA|nr:hypothetical protein JKP88DRAFT_311493 [Tribonema minus]
MECKDGVVVTTREGMGQVLQAVRDFAPGDLVLRERPLVDFVTGSRRLTLLQKFVRMTPEQRQELCEMRMLAHGGAPRFTSCEQLMEDRQLPAQAQARLIRPSLDIPTSMWLTAYQVARFNSQEFSIVPLQQEHLNHAQRHLPPEVPQMRPAAVFSLASKAAHSCVPNCLFTTKNPYGAMSYYAAHPIAAGDLVTIARVACGGMSTLDRWAQLARRRDCLCACARCAGPDATRGIRCARCRNGVAVPTHAPPPPQAREVPALAAATWRCNQCGAAPEPGALAAALAEQQWLEEYVALFTAPLATFCLADADDTLRQLRFLISRARSALCGVHGVAFAAGAALRTLRARRDAHARCQGAAIAIAIAANDACPLSPAPAHPRAAAAAAEARNELRAPNTRHRAAAASPAAAESRARRVAAIAVDLLGCAECAAAGCAGSSGGGGGSSSSAASLHSSVKGGSGAGTGSSISGGALAHALKDGSSSDNASAGAAVHHCYFDEIAKWRLLEGILPGFKVPALS